MIGALANHLWQSTVFVAAAAIVVLALRRNGAHIRHAVWVVASVKFLVPFSILLSAGSLLPRIAPAADGVTSNADPSPELSVVVDRLARPFADTSTFIPAAPDTASPATADWMPVALAGVWTCGFAIVVLVRLRGWQRVRAAVLSSAPLPVASPVPVRTAPGLMEPGVVGIWRPVVLVPERIEERLTPPQLHAVLEHELCHVRRRDNLTSALHMIVEAVFWFHPLVWIVGARLIAERERACDEHVLRAGGEPETYAESILNVCKLYVESPLACVAGVSGTDLKKRISAIMNNRVGSQLNPTRKAALVAAGLLAIATPIVAGSLAAPASSRQDRPAASAQNARFEVVSIKPCDPDSPTTSRIAPAPAGGRSGMAPWSAQTTPGSVYWHCATLAQLVGQAYADQEQPLRNVSRRMRADEAFQPQFVRGGPSWATTERFTIDARAPLDLTTPVLAGRPSRALADLPPALSQALRATLEDRFQVKVRRATEQRDMYALKVAKGGLNAERMRPTTPADCVTQDQYFATEAAARDALRICGRYFSGRSGFEFTGFTLRDLADALANILDPFVLDETGLTGKYTFVLRPNGAATTQDDAFAGGLEPLGLRLERTKGPAEYLVIESAQRLRPDLPAAAAAPAPQKREEFDVVSIKPCADVSTARTGRGAGPNLAQTSPGRVYWACVTLAALADQAYAGWDFPLLNRKDGPLALEGFGARPAGTADESKRVRGGPEWIYTDRFAIEATASIEVISPAGGNLLRLPAPMNRALRTLLADRFKLQLRRETEERPMYALTMAKSGFKARPRGPDDCVVPPTDAKGRPRLDGFWEGQWLCGMFLTAPRERLERFWAGEKPGTPGPGPNRRIEYRGVTLARVTEYLSSVMDRFVLDRTGVSGEFLFAVEYTTNEQAPGGGMALIDRPTGPGADRQPKVPEGRGDTIFQAFDALGLRIEPAKGPSEYLIIDRAERPSPDAPARPPATAPPPGTSRPR